MLRKTALKAFGPGDPERAGVPPAPHETQRGLAVERLFRGLHETLEAAAAAEGDSPATVRVTRPRPLAVGIEFRIEGPAAGFLFLNTLAGLIRVHRSARGQEEPFEILSVQLQGGTLRPIRKPIRPGGAVGGSSRANRTPFQYASIAGLAREYLAEAKSIHKIDT